MTLTLRTGVIWRSQLARAAAVHLSRLRPGGVAERTGLDGAQQTQAGARRQNKL